MTRRYCEGCCVYKRVDPDDVACRHILQNDEGQCPCTKCIIKVMCEEPCEDYLDFRKLAIKRERTETMENKR
jgi:hypothetical protein